jgi:deoxyribose-phosphate aldolase
MNLNNYIEHTILKPDTTTDQIKELCQEAIDYEFAGVCVPPFFVKTAANLLDKHAIKVVTVVGFPMGYDSIPSKVEATKRAIDDGTDEVDMVINIAAVKDANWSHVSNDIDSVTTAVHLKGKIIKVILETALLSIAEIKKLCEICTKVGVDYVKTSTGVNAGGATIEMVQYLKENVEGIKIKASGGIRTKEFATQLIEAGATRLGTSSGIKIVA